MKSALIVFLAAIIIGQPDNPKVFAVTEIDCVDEQWIHLRTGEDIKKGEILAVPLLNKCSCVRKVQSLD